MASRRMTSTVLLRPLRRTAMTKPAAKMGQSVRSAVSNVSKQWGRGATGNSRRMTAASSSSSPASWIAELPSVQNADGAVVAALDVSTTATTAKSSVEGKRFNVAESSQVPALIGASLPLLLRVGSGALVRGWSPRIVRSTDDSQASYSMVRLAGFELSESAPAVSRPLQPLILFDSVGCPFCRKVREACALLDLDCLVLPTPRGGRRFRKQLTERAGRMQVPYLIDPNTDAEMPESDDIIAYLFKTYGSGGGAGDSTSSTGDVPLGLRLGPLTNLTCAIAMAPRMGKGQSYVKSKFTADESGYNLRPLWLWGYEASPFVAVVREQLCALEIPHVYRSCARGSAKRQTIFEKEGQFQVPYLEDPNNNTAMFESTAIIKYLHDEYALEGGDAASGETPSSS